MKSKWYNEIGKLEKAKDDIEIKMMVNEDQISLLKGTSEDEDAKTLSEEVLIDILK